MSLRIFTGVWGSQIDLFDKACAESLSWPSNKAAIKGSTWNIATEEKNFARVKEIRERCGVFYGELIPIHSGQDAVTQFSGHLYREMKKCVEQKATFLFALPDWIFGDGTVENLKTMMEPGLCLAVPNVRCLPSILNDDKYERGCNLNNQELVTVAFRNLHQTWKQAELGKPTINSFYGGVSWKQITNELAAVTHRLPSSFLCQFTDSDIEFFQTQGSFAAWDHAWPSKLIKEGRQRYISSSDLAFIVEVTEANKNLSPDLPLSPNGPTDFYRNLLHHQVNHNVVTVFRKA